MPALGSRIHKWCVRFAMHFLPDKVDARPNRGEHGRYNEAHRGTGAPMARKPKADSVGEIKWSDPLVRGKGRPFLLEDDIHIVYRVEYVPNGIAYTLKCGLMVTFIAIHPVLEAELKLPEPTCLECLS